MFHKRLQRKGKIFFHGGFQFKFIELCHSSETNDIINLMMTHYLLPHILCPTQVTDHSAMIIDNIFTNITEFN